MNIRTSSGQDRLKRIFIHNFREKALAALCAVIVLILSFSLKPIYKIYTFKVNTRIAADQMLISQNTHLIEVKVSGTFFDLRKIKAENLEINFDFSAEKAGEISRSIGEKELPSAFINLSIESIFPAMLTWQTEAKIEKTVPVNIVSDDGEKEINYTADPSEIKITGAESIVNGIEKINTEKIPVDAFADKTEIEIPLVFPAFTAPTDGTTKVKVTKTAGKADDTNPENGGSEEKND